MSFRKKGQGVLLLLGGFCAFSCSVLEDRSDCPCILTLNVREVPSQVPEDAFPVRWHLSQGEWRQSGQFSLQDCDGSIFVVVPRGGAQAYAVAGDESLFYDGLKIQPGHGCPPVRLWTAHIDARGENASATVRLRKEHCRLAIIPVGSPATLPYRMVAEGNIAGYDAYGTPLEGPFHAEALPDKDGTCAGVILPRQTDDSLLLHIYDAGDAADAPTAAPIRTFALGHAMAAAGYDWTAPDLDDLTLELDFAATTLTLRSDRWSRSLPFEVVI